MVSNGNGGNGGNPGHGKELNFKPEEEEEEQGTKRKVFNEKCTEFLMRPACYTLYSSCICMSNFASVYLPETQMKTLKTARFNVKII